MTKITIFSGFLGAGKTTLIKKLIAEGYKGEKLVLIENDIMCVDILNSLYNVAEFADTRWFDEYAVGLVGLKHLLECFTEVAHQ